MSNCIITDFFMYINMLEFLHYIITTTMEIITINQFYYNYFHITCLCFVRHGISVIALKP